VNSRTSNHEPSLATANCEGLSTVFPVVNSRARSLLSRTGGHVWLSLNVQGKARTIAFPPVRERRAHSSAPRERRHTAHPVAMAADPAWMTISQLCRRWQLGRKTVYKFIDAKILPAWRVGRHLYRIAVSDVLRFEARNRLRSR